MMTLTRVPGFGGSPMRGHAGHSTAGAGSGALALVFAALGLAGCTIGAHQESPLVQQASIAVGTGTAVATGTPTTTDQAAAGDIPAGRGIAEGGGGPLSYTFREEWRRALAAAQNWRSGAYLISASGDFVNDDGVPSQWTVAFIDKADADAVLVGEIDPWGKVTATREVTGDGVSSFVGQYTKRMPYAIMDSDTAVGLGKTALASRYDLAKTKDPRIGLNFSLVDGSGPFWTYTLFDESTATYVSVQIDALTGEVTATS